MKFGLDGDMNRGLPLRMWYLTMIPISVMRPSEIIGNPLREDGFHPSGVASTTLKKRNYTYSS
jgi:hypothetical protein